MIPAIITGTMSTDSLASCRVVFNAKRLRTLDDQVGPEDTHGGDTDTRLGRAVGGAHAGEDDGAGAAHGTEEGLIQRLARFVSMRLALPWSAIEVPITW